MSFTPDRAKVLTFSRSYYNVNQSVVALKSNPISKVRSQAGLKGYKLGAQLGTTSYQYIVNRIKPSQSPSVYDTNDLAVAALKSKQIDGLVADLPTAFFVTAAQVPNSTVVGQFPSPPGGEHFGMVFQKGNPLVNCVEPRARQPEEHRGAREDPADLAGEGDEGACPQIGTGARGSSGVAALDAPSPSRSSAPSSAS